MNCPKCQTATLAEFKLEGVAVDRCSRCDGTWFDARELSQLLVEDARVVADLRRGSGSESADVKKGRAAPVMRPNSCEFTAPSTAASPWTPAPTPSPRPTQTTAFIGVPTATMSRTPSPESVTEEATEIIDTPTSTVTAEPTPIIGIIRASEGGGPFIREKPGGKVLATLGNGSTVTIVPNDLQDINGVIWVHVIAFTNDVRVEGWMIQTVLMTATPVAEWQPSSTPEFTETP